MPTPIDLFVSGLYRLGSVWETVDRNIFDREGYYTNDDVLVIEAARKNYLRIFSKSSDGSECQVTLPRELRYKHEANAVMHSGAVDLAENRPKVVYKYHRPPRYLSQEYSLRDVALGANAISKECSNAILAIQGYLSLLNGKASTFWNRRTPFVSYGHQSDSLRAILVLVMDAFALFSTINLNERSSVESVSNYADFLSAVLSEEEVVNAFSKIDPSKANLRDNESRTPLYMLYGMQERLQEIAKKMSYQFSRCSIAEHTMALQSQLNEAARRTRIFLTYIMSAHKVEEIDLATDLPVEQNKGPLFRLQCELKKQEMLTDVVQTGLGTSRAESDALVSPTKTGVVNFYYDSDKDKWVGVRGVDIRAGVYSKFNDADIQDYLELCACHRVICDMAPAVTNFLSMLGVGGDLVAVNCLDLYFNVAWDALNATFNRMFSARDRIDERAQSILKGLTNAKLEKADVTWRGNYTHMRTLLNAHHLSDNMLKRNFQGSLDGISSGFKAWIEHPEEKITPYIDSKRNLHAILSVVGRRVSTFQPEHARVLEALLASDPSRDVLLDGMRRKVILQRDRKRMESLRTDPTRIEEIREEAHQSVAQSEPRSRAGVLGEIEAILIRYSKHPDHQYTFNLPQVDASIRLMVSAAEEFGEKHSSKKPDIKQNTEHQVRRGWIYDAFEILFSGKSDGIILKALKMKIASICKNPNAEPKKKEFQSAYTSVLGHGMVSELRDISQLVESRLTLLEQTQPQVFYPPQGPINAAEEEMAHMYSPREDEASSESEASTPTEEGDSCQANHERTYTGVVAEIKRWVDEYVETDRDKFLAFWARFSYAAESKLPKLLYLGGRTAARLLAYQEKQTLFYQLKKRQQLLEKIEKGLLKEAPETQKTWALTAVEKAGGLRAKAETWVKEQKTSVDTALTKAESALFEAHEKTLGGLLIKRKTADGKDDLPVRVAWPQKMYYELVREINVLNHETPGSPSVDRFRPEVVLSAVSLSLMQLPHPFLDATELTEYFCEILEKHKSLCEKSSSAEQAQMDFYIQIASGLLHMGADPLVWMRRQSTEGQVEVSQTSAAGYFLAAAQIDMILAHLQYKANEHFGACDLFLKREFEDLLASFKSFAESLTTCIDWDERVL